MGAGAAALGEAAKANDPNRTMGNKLDAQFDERTQKALAGEAAWEAVAGMSIHEALAEQYAHLTVGKLAAGGNEALENAYTQASDRLSADLRGRGIDVKSGVSTQLMAQQLSDLSTAKGKMYAQAEQQYKAELAQGVQIGQQLSGQVNQAIGAQANYNNQLSVQGQNQQRIDYSMKNPYEQKQTTAMVDLGKKVYGAYKDYTGTQKNLIPGDIGTLVQ